MVELNFDVKKQNIQAFVDTYSHAECEALALQNKEKVIGNLFSGIKKLVSSKHSVKITNFEKRYEPFWHIVGKIELEYKRKQEYGFQVKPEVKTVKINGKVHNIKEGTNWCSLTGEDHCFEENKKELMVNASTGDANDYSKYLEFKTRPLKETEELMKGKNVVIPAKVKASFLVRQLIKDILKPIAADKIIQEKVVITKRALFFRPVYAFELIDEKTGKKGVLDVDALTGEVTKGNIIGKGLAEIFSEGDLFEIGTELVTDFLPGTKATVMLVKKVRAAREKKRKQKEENKKRAGGK